MYEDISLQFRRFKINLILMARKIEKRRGGKLSLKNIKILANSNSWKVRPILY